MHCCTTHLIQNNSIISSPSQTLRFICKVIPASPILRELFANIRGHSCAFALVYGEVTCRHFFITGKYMVHVFPFPQTADLFVITIFHFEMLDQSAVQIKNKELDFLLIVFCNNMHCFADEARIDPDCIIVPGGAYF